MAVGEWDQRQLCSDGACVGVIGPDGTCKMCGRAAQNWGDERKRGLIDPPDEPDASEPVAAAAATHDDGFDEDVDDLDEDEADDEDEDEQDGEDDLDDDEAAPVGAAASPPAAAAPVEWGTRQLCPDGSCIGLIGGDGRCKVCGRAANGASPGGAQEASAAMAATDSPAAAAAIGFTVVTTDGAVATTDDAVQTTASTIKTDEPGEARDPAAPAEPAADRDPDSQEPPR
jgi:hypothetical protein